jgi:hypothetical protein
MLWEGVTLTLHIHFRILSPSRTFNTFNTLCLACYLAPSLGHALSGGGGGGGGLERERERENFFLAPFQPGTVLEGQLLIGLIQR